MEKDKAGNKVLAKALVVILVFAAFLVMPLAVTADGEQEACIYVDKLVWDGEDWVDELYDVSLGEPLSFMIVIENCGNVPLHRITVYDWLYGLGYADNAILEPMGTSLDPPDIMVDFTWYFLYTEWGIAWFIDNWTDPDLVLMPDETIAIYFDATVEECWGCDNCVDVGAMDPWGIGVWDYDCVDIYPECPGKPSVDVEKWVQDPETEEWVEELEAYVCQILTFKIVVHNDGGVPLAGVFFEDILSESLDYIDGTADPEPWWMWTNGVTGLYWDFYELDPCETITITFDAHVNMAGEDTNEVCVYGYPRDYWYWDSGMALSKTMRDRAGSDKQYENMVSDCDTVYIYGLPSAPDLIVEKEVTVEGSYFTVDYTVKNIGTGTAGESTTCLYYGPLPYGASRAKSTNGGCEDQYCRALEPGGSQEGTFGPLECPPCDGVFMADVEADCYDEVVEIDEDNNYMLNDIDNPCKPDLVVEKMLNVDEEGNYFIVHYLVTNIGGSPAEASTTCKYVDDELQETKPCPALAPGESYGGAFDVEECPCGQTIEVKVCADNDDNVEESDEFNNCMVNYLECPPCPDAELCPAEYRWSVYHDPDWKFDYPLLWTWQDVRFVNLGPGDAFNVVATVTYAPVNVDVLDAEVTLRDIPEGGSAWSLDFFAFEVDTSNPQSESDTIRWDVEYDDHAGVHHVLQDVPQWCPG